MVRARSGEPHARRREPTKLTAGSPLFVTSSERDSSVRPPRWHRIAAQRDLGLSALLAAALILNNTFWSSSVSPWRVVLGVLVGLVVPGYLLVALLFPRRSDLDDAARWGLVVVLNTTLLMGSVFLLSVMAIGLTAVTVTGTLGIVVLLLTAGVMWRRWRLQPVEVYRLRPPMRRAPWLVLLFAVFLAFVTWAIAGANLRAAQPELTILGPGGQISGYPFQVHEGEISSLLLQVNNPTDHAADYRLVESDQHRRVLSRISLHLRARRIWSKNVLLPSGSPAAHEQVVFSLYQNGKIVRQVWVRYRIVL